MITQGLKIKIILTKLYMSLVVFNPFILNRVFSRHQIELNMPLPQSLLFSLNKI